jgi:NAD(P)H-flavin reductase/ferredoxin
MARKKLTITANKAACTAFPGELLLDAALQQGISLPHDCRVGQCGSCLVRLKQGQLLGGETDHPEIFHACQARVFSDVEIRYDRTPKVAKCKGTLVRVDRLTPDIRGVTLSLSDRARYMPGQYYRVTFRGYPTRCYSPSPPFVGSDDRKTLRFHIKMVRDGQVSSELDHRIQPGHKVRVEGPFGAAFFRPGEGTRLLLVASGTGFAPIWSIAKASLLRQPEVPLMLIAGVRKLSSLYMVPALCGLAAHPSADFVVTVDEAQSVSGIVRHGTPDQHLPDICSSDLVYAAGSPSMVEKVSNAAARSGAAFYADAFLPNGVATPLWWGGKWQRLRSMLGSCD